MTSASRADVASDAFDVIVIGSCANGLTAAATLAQAGQRVLVLESGDDIGGYERSREFAPGYSAPLNLEADWLPPTVARGLGLRPLATVELDVSASVADGDGGFLVVPRDPRDADAAIRPRSVRDAGKWGAFTERLRKVSGFLEALYQLPAPDIDTAMSFGEIPSLLGLARKFRALGRADMTELMRIMPMPIHDLLDDWFESSALKAAVAAAALRDIRQGPRSGGTSFVLLHYMVGAPTGAVRGRPWFRDGPNAFLSAVEAITRQRGVTIRLGVGVAHILAKDDAVTGVALADGREIAANAVVSTEDPARTLLGMVDPVWLDPEFLHTVRNIKFRGCTAVAQYALDRLPEAPGLANPAVALSGVVSLGSTLEALERAYDAAKYGMVSDQPHVEIAVPTLRWPSLAPPGKHVLVARARYAPYTLRDGGVWDTGRATTLSDSITAAIIRVMPKFADTVVHQTLLTPRDLQRRFGLTEGAVTQGELTLDQILFMRPVAGWGRHAMPIRGLYLGGIGAHPGPGVLGGAGWLAARRIIADGKGA